MVFKGLPTGRPEPVVKSTDTECFEFVGIPSLGYAERRVHPSASVKNPDTAAGTTPAEPAVRKVPTAG